MFTKAGLLYEKVNYRYFKKAIFVRHLRQNPLFFSLIVALLWRVRAQMSRGSSLLFVIVLPFCAMNHKFFYYIAQVRPLGRISTD